MRYQLPKIADNIEVGRDEMNALHFIFVNARRHLTVKADDATIRLVSLMDGTRSVSQLAGEVGASDDQVQALVQKMATLRLIRDAAASSAGNTRASGFERQIAFFSDFVESPEETQNKLAASTVVIIGLGTIGGAIAAHLARVGVSRLRAVDPDVVSVSNLSRHELFRQNDIGTPKIDAAKDNLRQLNVNSQFEGIRTAIKCSEDVERFAVGSDLVINCADQPSVAETSECVGRACMKLRIPHILAGGYRTHLGFVGPTVMPYQSACWKCFADDYYTNDPFGRSGWTPLPISRPNGGALGPLSAVIAGLHAWEAIRVLTGVLPPMMLNRKGEIDFAGFALSFHEVTRNLACPECSKEKRC